MKTTDEIIRMWSNNKDKGDETYSQKKVAAMLNFMAIQSVDYGFRYGTVRLTDKKLEENDKCRLEYLRTI